MESSSIVLCKDRLQEQLQKAKESLKGVDDNLKKFISRNISEAPLRSAFNKTAAQTADKWKSNKEESLSSNNRRRPARVLNDADIENIPVKKRLGPKVLHSSISGPPRKYDDIDDSYMKKPSVLSCVVAKPHVLPSRKDAVSVKTYTETRARDRRMFGALLGTLQKFRQEETQLKDKEDKKAKVEKKLEEAAKREKEKLRLERQRLMDIRKEREEYIKAVENNMKLVKEQEQWEELQQPLFNYIRTESSPTICYLPKVHNEKTTQLLEQCRTDLSKMIAEKRQSVKEEVDSLISQYKNVDIEELSQETGMSLQHTFSDRNTSENSESHHDTNVSNGSWSNDNNAKASWKSASNDTDNAYSAKEQRLKKKSKSETVFVKQEKEDDYEKTVSVKQEKIPVSEPATDKDGDEHSNVDRDEVPESKSEKNSSPEGESPKDVPEDVEKTSSKMQTEDTDAMNDEMNDEIDHSVY